MRLIDEFSQRALSNTGSFTIATADKADKSCRSYYHFLQSNVGNARYIYGVSNYRNEKFISGLKLKPELVAIVSGEKIYIVNNFFLNIYSCGTTDILLPDNVTFLDCKEANTYIRNVIFPEFYKKLEVTEVENEHECKKTARRIVLSNTTFREFDLDGIFNLQDVANMLCGFVDINEESVRRLEKDRDYYIRRKSTDAKIREYLKDPTIAADWELKIAEGLSSVEAKTVTVQFELNNKRASEKIEPDIVIRKMTENDCFSSYDFEVTKRGKQLINELGAGEWCRDKNALRCSNITKITYGKRVLYER